MYEPPARRDSPVLLSRGAARRWERAILSALHSFPQRCLSNRSDARHLSGALFVDQAKTECKTACNRPC